MRTLPDAAPFATDEPVAMNHQQFGRITGLSVLSCYRGIEGWRVWASSACGRHVFTAPADDFESLAGNELMQRVAAGVARDIGI